MKISFHGAAGTVTGSCTLIETEHCKILIDAGMFQGRAAYEKRNARLPRIKFQDIDAVVLTHAHLDHCGRLPVFVARGLDCPIYTTAASADLTRLILSDAAHIQMEDAKRESRRNARRGKGPVVPLFSFREVHQTMRHICRVQYGSRVEIAEGIEAIFHDAGHILGAAIVELWIRDGATRHHIVFSGDIGFTPQPVLANPTTLSQARLVVMESTYGDRNHRSDEDTIEELREIIDLARKQKGKILIPSFAVGRTQTLLYLFREMANEGLLKGLPVFLDSPMAIEATDIYDRYRELYDSETREVIRHANSPFDFHNLEILQTAEDSRQINHYEGAAIVIAGAGMCNGGRIQHHFRHYLWRENTHVVFVGFQAEGTLGRKLVDGSKSVRVMGDPIRVRAQIHTIGGLSAHADQGQLLDWIRHFEPSNPTVVLNHGEDRAREPLAVAIKEQTGLKVQLASEQQPIEL